LIKDIKGNAKGDIIFFGNGNSASCGASLSTLKIGEEAIIKVNKQSFKSLLYTHSFEKNKQQQKLKMEKVIRKIKRSIK